MPNYLGQPIQEPMRCKACKGTGRNHTIGLGPRADPWCKLCRGSGWLMPEPPADHGDE